MEFTPRVQSASMRERPDARGHLAIAAHIREKMEGAASNFLYPLLTFSRKRLCFDFMPHDPAASKRPRLGDVALEEIGELGNPERQPLTGCATSGHSRPPWKTWRTPSATGGVCTRAKPSMASATPQARRCSPHSWSNILVCSSERSCCIPLCRGCHPATPDFRANRFWPPAAKTILPVHWRSPNNWSIILRGRKLMSEPSTIGAHTRSGRMN